MIWLLFIDNKSIQISMKNFVCWFIIFGFINKLNRNQAQFYNVFPIDKNQSFEIPKETWEAAKIISQIEKHSLLYLWWHLYYRRGDSS
jgi:hypothetical protein